MKKNEKEKSYLTTLFAVLEKQLIHITWLQDYYYVQKLCSLACYKKSAKTHKDCG